MKTYKITFPLNYDDFANFDEINKRTNLEVDKLKKAHKLTTVKNRRLYSVEGMKAEAVITVVFEGE